MARHSDRRSLSPTRLVKTSRFWLTDVLVTHGDEAEVLLVGALTSGSEEGDGGTAGLVTLEDILEEIVGEIRDEDDMDEDEDVQKLKDGRYIVDPLMTLSDLSDELGIELEPPENSHVETLSGLIQATLGIIPSPGAEVKIQGYTFRVLKMDGTRMEKVMLILPPGKAGPKTQALKKI